MDVRNSYRTLKLPAEIMTFLNDYKAYQSEYIKMQGDKWVESIEGIDGKMVAPDRLFTKWNGDPMFPNSPSLFFERFCKKHGINFYAAIVCAICTQVLKLMPEQTLKLCK